MILFLINTQTHTHTDAEEKHVLVSGLTTGADVMKVSYLSIYLASYLSIDLCVYVCMCEREMHKERVREREVGRIAVP